MAADQDLLFGRIAVHRQFCTQAQLDEALAVQARSRDPIPLGHILRDEGYISEDQHSQVLAIQRQNLSAVDPVSKASRESTLLGRLAVREKFMTEANVNACLRLQGREGEKRSIGEIMVAQGHLRPEQLQQLLSMQHKWIMSCAPCRLSFTVLSIARSKKILCPRCKAPLQEGKPGDSVRTDADLETSVSIELKKAAAKKASPVGSSSVRLVKMTCPMCSTPFAEPVDTKGRVDCPRCRSSFSA